jgi:TM2 domain-containing membrane protein YozV
VTQQAATDERRDVVGAQPPADTPPQPPVVVRRRNPVVAASLSVLPGLGQLYNGQVRKAVAFLLATLFTLGPSVLLIMAGESFGHDLLQRKDFGVFLVVAFGSIIAFLVLFLLGLTFWASAAVDARRSAIELSEGRRPTQRWMRLKL